MTAIKTGSMQNLEKQRTVGEQGYVLIYILLVDLAIRHVRLKTFVSQLYSVQWYDYYQSYLQKYSLLLTLISLFHFSLSTCVTDLGCIVCFYFSLALLTIVFGEQLSSYFECFPCGLWSTQLGTKEDFQPTFIILQSLWSNKYKEYWLWRKYKGCLPQTKVINHHLKKILNLWNMQMNITWLECIHMTQGAVMRKSMWFNSHPKIIDTRSIWFLEK